MQFTVLNGVEIGSTSCNNWYTAGIGSGSNPVRFIYLCPAIRCQFGVSVYVC